MEARKQEADLYWKIGILDVKAMNIRKRIRRKDPPKKPKAEKPPLGLLSVLCFIVCALVVLWVHVSKWHGLYTPEARVAEALAIVLLFVPSAWAARILCQPERFYPDTGKIPDGPGTLCLMVLAVLPIAFLALARVTFVAVDGGEDAEEIAALRDVVAGMVLLMAVTYMMLTLWLAKNDEDRALQKQTWKALHIKISIFCAVLMYQALKGIFGSDSEELTLHKAASCLGGVALWFSLLQFLMASLSFDELSRPIWRRSSLWWSAVEEDDAEWNNRRKVLLCCLGTLLGHVVGFASIDVWGLLQQWLVGLVEIHMLKVFASLCAVLLQIALTILWYYEFRRFRKRAVIWLEGEEQPSLLQEISFGTSFKSQNLTHQQKEARERRLEAHEQWEDMCQDTENDAISLTTSFLFCQCFRLWIVGELPDSEGNEERLQLVNGSAFEAERVTIHNRTLIATGNFVHPHTYLDAGVLYFSGIVLFVFIVYFNINFAEGLKERLCKTLEAKRRFQRICCTADSIGSFCLAWVSFYGSQWLLDTINKDWFDCDGHESGLKAAQCGTGGMSGSITLALVVTVGSYATIICVRSAARGVKKPVLQEIVKSVLAAPGLLIGFGWEKSFDQAVEAASLEVRYPKCMKMFLAVFVSSMVIRIWKIHIVPGIISIEEDSKTTAELKELYEEDKSSDKREFKREFEEKRDEMYSRCNTAINKARTKLEWLYRRDQPDADGASAYDKDKGGKRGGDLNHLRRIMVLAEALDEYDVHSKGLFDNV